MLTIKKRIYIPKAKPGQLVARYGKTDRGAEPSICYAWGGQGADSSDARILQNAIEDANVFAGKTLAEELEARGYDIATLKFSIEKKKSPVSEV